MTGAEFQIVVGDVLHATAHSERAAYLARGVVADELGVRPLDVQILWPPEHVVHTFDGPMSAAAAGLPTTA